MTTIGYARVSTDGQSLAAQDAALREAGCERVFAEKQTQRSNPSVINGPIRQRLTVA
jgi:DNA invertase Pin-like site-specific DNA recombinase